MLLDLSTIICVPSKIKDLIVKIFNMITRIYEGETFVKHILHDCKWKFNSTTCDSNQKRNNQTCLCESKDYHTSTKDYSWNPSI